MGSMRLACAPLGYFTVAPSHGAPVAIVLQDQTLHTLQRVIDEADGRVSQLKAQDVGLSGR